MEGSSSPLLLTLLGSCVVPAAIENEVLTFKTPVRSKQARIVTISNKYVLFQIPLLPVLFSLSFSSFVLLTCQPCRTTTLWKLKPSIDNMECWSGEKIGKQLEVAPGATANYELTYYPLFMTSEKIKHKYDP